LREAALEAARRLKLPSAESAHLSDLGLAYTDLGEMTQAVQCFEQCLKILLALGDRQGESNALINIGNIYFGLEETRCSIEFHERALKIRRKIGDRRGVNLVHWEI
jgi:tetratricopeptide (TPR) repeat protein